MFLTFSKILKAMGGIRIGTRMKMDNPLSRLALCFILVFYLMWYMIIGMGWILYGMCWILYQFVRLIITGVKKLILFTSK